MTRSAIRHLTHQIPCALENSREQKKHERTTAIFILVHFPFSLFYFALEHREKIFRGGQSEVRESEKNEENRKRSSGRFHAKIQIIEFKLSGIRCQMKSATTSLLTTKEALHVSSSHKWATLQSVSLLAASLLHQAIVFDPFFYRRTAPLKPWQRISSHQQRRS